MATQARIVLTAEDRASRVIGQVSSQMAAASDSARGLAGAAGLVAFVKHVIDARDALNDVADATGASIEGLSGLERVAKLNGGTLDDVAGILLKFNTALQAAGDPKSDAAAVFKSLGLSVKELQAADPAAALQQTAVALRQFAADGNLARAQYELLGKTTRVGAAYLKDLAEAGTLVATNTAEQADQAERLNKQLFAMRVAAEDAGRSLTKELGGTLGELVLRFQTAQSVFGGFLGALQAGVGQKLNFADPVAGLTEFNRQLADLDIKIKRVQDGEGLAATASARIKRLQDERVEVAKVAAYYRSLAGLNSPGADQPDAPRLPSIDTKKVPAVTPKKEEIDQVTKSLFGYVEQLDRELIKTQDLTIVQEALIKLQDAGATGQIPMIRATVLAKAEALQISKQQEELEKAITAELERQAKAQQTLDEALERFSGRTADAIKQAQTARLEARLAAGEVFSPEELDRVVKGIAGVELQAQETTDTMAKMLDQFARNAQDALGDTFEATLKGNFDSIGQLWGNLLIKMASQAAAAQLGQVLFGDFAKSGNFGGLLGTALGAIGIGAPRANGGSVGAMSLQRVNERGFEVFSTGGQDWLMTGGRGGVVTPSSQVQAATQSAAPIINVHNNVQAGVTRGELTAAVQWGMQQAVQVIERRLRNQRVIA